MSHPIPRVSAFGEVLVDEHDSHGYASSLHSPYPPSYHQWPVPQMPQRTDTVTSQDTIDKERPTSPEVASPGLESVWDHDQDKEVVNDDQAITPHPLDPLAERKVTKRRICGIPVWLFWTLLALVVCLAIGLGVGLGVGLNNKKSSPTTVSTPPSASATAAAIPTNTATSDYEIGGALDQAYYSKSGAFNGTGLALASQSFGTDEHGTLVMYYQHYTGDIRYEQLSSQGEWQGGTVSETVANDARNGTPISAVAYALNGTSTWHIFYLDVNNTVRQKTNTNTTNLWVDGTINSLNLKALDADQVGMQACWYGNDYGDSDYVHTPLPANGDSAAADAHNEVGMHIWYASDNQTFQQLGWRDGDTNWTFQGSWTNKNGHAGVGCYSWGPGTTTYVMLVNLANVVEVWWKDTNSSSTPTTQHPINEWVNSSIGIGDVHPSTSIGYTNYLVLQSADDGNAVVGYNVSWAAENSSLVPGDMFTIPTNPGLPGTHLSVTALPDSSGGDTLNVFFQVDGNDISQFNRDLVGGQWTSAALDVPS